MDPEIRLWENVPVQNIHTIPLNARRDPIDEVQFQSVVNDEGIAFRLGVGRSSARPDFESPSGF